MIVEAMAAPSIGLDVDVLSGPVRVRSENVWRVELSDGRRCTLAQLLPELAADEALRRRYVYDAERRAAIEVDGLAALIELGPKPNPRDPDADPPWRLRQDPRGMPLAELLSKRAPLPPDEAIELVAALAEVLHRIHVEGVVLRDLEPRNVVVTSSDPVELWLTDIGLARVDILSTRTASSLMLEGSPYAAPEHLRATVLDSRADIYTLGVILWEALTGEVPFAEEGAFFRDRAKLPSLKAVGVDAPAGLDALIGACLEEQPEKRPESAEDVAAALSGRRAFSSLARGNVALALVVCQACGARLRPGLRLCLSCGKQAVQFSHASSGDDSALFEVQLLAAREDGQFVTKLREFFEAVGQGPVPELNFLIGDSRMYSKAERIRLHKLPATLINNIDESTAEALAKRLTDDGFKVKVVASNARKSRAVGTRLFYGGGIMLATGVVVTTLATPIVGIPLLFGGAVLAVVGMVVGRRKRRRLSEPLAGLRATPAALPASDPLIARLGLLLRSDLAADVRARLEEIALLVQRLIDHRARESRSQSQSLDLERLIEPVEPIVSLVEREASAIEECDSALSSLEEGRIVRAIAASEARGEPRNVRVELLAGLDRLRGLEEARAAHMERLLEASSLMRRTVNLSLGARSEESESERLVAMARAALET